MLWVLKRTVSMRLFFKAPKTYKYAKADGYENIYNFALKIYFSYKRDLVLNLFYSYAVINTEAKVIHAANTICLCSWWEKDSRPESATKTSIVSTQKYHISELFWAPKNKC